MVKLLQSLFEKKDMGFLGHYSFKDKTYVKLLLPVLAKEVDTFSQIKKFKFSSKNKKNYVTEMLNTLEDEYPEVKFSLLKSSKEIKKVQD